MKLFDVYGWEGRDQEHTPEGEYVGVAIGPESEEGVCRVNGKLLQAGRPLALPARSYVITRVHGEPGGDDDNNLTATTRLQLALLTCKSELACEFARPSVRYSAAVAAGGRLTVPFSGRRHALITMVYAGDLAPEPSATYTIVGRRYSHARRNMIEHTLVTGNVTAPSTAKHIGGTNESEPWDELAIDIAANAVNVDVDAIGESGVR